MVVLLLFAVLAYTIAYFDNVTLPSPAVASVFLCRVAP
jgi:hypothetical protein